MVESALRDLRGLFLRIGVMFWVVLVAEMRVHMGFDIGSWERSE